jgi:hypothetical protein
LKRLTRSTDAKTAAKILGRSESAVRVRASLRGFSWRYTEGVHPLIKAAKLCGVSKHAFLSVAERAGVQIPPPNTSGIRPIVDSQIAIIKLRLKEEKSGKRPGPKIGRPRQPRVQVHGRAGKELLRQRAVYTRALVFLERIQKQGTGVTLYAVMSHLSFKAPYKDHTDAHLIFEAAEKLEMVAKREKHTTLFR